MAAAIESVPNIAIATMLLIIGTPGAELAPDPKTSIAGTNLLGMPTFFAIIITIGNKENTNTNPSTPPNVKATVTMSIANTARFTCFSPSTVITNLSTNNTAIDSAAPQSVYIFPNKAPKKIVGKSITIIPVKPPTCMF